MKISKKDLAGMIDHTLLASTATQDKIAVICKEGKEYGFASVCVNSCWVSLCKSLLESCEVKVCSVVGFPLGAMATAAKAYEAGRAVQDGADEIDMVMNVGKLLPGTPEDLLYVKNDIKAVVEVASGNPVKVILETGYLSDEQVVTACRIAEDAGAHFVKTSTGFGPPFEMKHIRLMRSTVGNTMGVKAAGGIKTYEKAIEVIQAGASRIGASAGVTIVKGAE
ncbi:MAG: deoxyribose-phosphate aldolase [Theionarchaea archaeon]|nr:deoxyribose-phosphate aldolase [Theionarchaea archaeon]MBU7000737.1 deoxyribose-phosphate aldolase [Theionarchaea archaeon]MBU7021480.1 deoxyribose-phosphate aldolase [Theionarchaea archaeon]MBU7033579.1 deoxyribose-phosphate aldolase [Theionarchaea archaeon]MBU7039611.1 deoxyribose-phosphate aldolase [Theionarchaea archaeon]